MELIREDTINRLQGYFDLAKPAAPSSIVGRHSLAPETEKEKLIIRPEARKFLVRSSRCNIHFSVQQRIFAIRYKWTFTELLEVLVDPQYKLEVLPNHNPFEKLCQAVETNNEEEIQKLLHSPFIDLSTHNYHLLYVASQFGNIEVVKHLLTIPNIDINTDNPMVIACEFGHYEIAKLLYEKGADPSIADSFSFRLAAENGHANIVRLFINDKRINVNAQDEYAIKQACEENHYEVVKILMDHPSVSFLTDPNSPVLVDSVHHGGKLLRTLFADTKIGYPAVGRGTRLNKLFGYARVNYCLETCKILLADLRVDPGNYFAEDCVDPQVLEVIMKDDRFYSLPDKMHSALIVATKKGWLSIVEFMFNNYDTYIRLDVTKMEFFNSVVFPLASKRGHVHVMEFLYNNGVTQLDSENHSAFFSAIKYGHLPAVQYLVSLGLHPHISENLPYTKAFIHARYNILEYFFSLNNFDELIPLDITTLQIQHYPSESFIKIILTFGHRFKILEINTPKSSFFYMRLCENNEVFSLTATSKKTTTKDGYKLLCYLIDHFPSCKTSLLRATPKPVKRNARAEDELPLFLPRPVDFLLPQSRAFFTVVYYYYKTHCLLLLELTDFLLDDVIRYIFEFILMSGFSRENSVLCDMEIENNYVSFSLNNNNNSQIDMININELLIEGGDEQMEGEDDEEDDDESDEDEEEGFEAMYEDSLDEEDFTFDEEYFQF
jgi:ankyrin repeat protein